MRKDYGNYIDNHDVVMRFNALSLQSKFKKHVGGKATIRVFNHSRSRQACCRKDRAVKVGKPNDNSTAYILWHPGGLRY